MLVGPNSGYGEDNSCLLDTLAAGEGRYRGMAVVPNDIRRTEIAALKAAGVLGVTLNAALLGVEYYADAGPLLAHLEALDVIAGPARQLPDLRVDRCHRRSGRIVLE